MLSINGRAQVGSSIALLDVVVFAGPAIVSAALLFGLGGVERGGAFRHVLVVLLIWMAFWCVKATLRNDRFCAARWVTSLAQSLVWYALFLVQVGSIIAITAWGQLLTWPMAAAYLKQAPETLHALGVPPWMALGGAALSAIPVWLAASVFRKRPRSSWRPANASPVLVDAGLIALAAGAMHLALTLTASFKMEQREPLSVLFAPQAELSAFYTWSIPPSPLREAEAKAARAAYLPAPPDTHPNIVLIVMDALRSDRIGAFGYGRAITPTIDEYLSAKESWTAPVFRAVCAETSCGLLALGRSKYPWEITPKDFSLYEVLKLNGYRNFFYLSGDFTNFYGLRQTFRPYDIYLDSTEILDAALNDDRAIVDAFSAAPRFDGTPTFIQFQLMSAHGLGVRHPENRRFEPQLSPYLVHLKRRLPTDVDVKKLVNHYDNGVAQLDAELNRLFSLLKEKGYLSNAVVVLTGDHGELLGESGYVTHARSTEEAVLSTPLIVRAFGDGVQARAHPAPVLASQVDVAPTLLNYAGLPIPSSWSGIPLQNQATSRSVFFAQGSERGLYSFSNGRIKKFTLNINNGTERIESLSARGTIQPLAPEDMQSATDQSAHWRQEIDAEIGVGWTGKDEVD